MNIWEFLDRLVERIFEHFLFIFVLIIIAIIVFAPAALK